MKKRVLICVTVLLIASLICFSGCEATIESIIINPNTLDTTIVKGNILDTSKVEGTVKYSDDSVVELQSNDFTFGDIDTTTSGVKELKVTYKDYEFTIKIKVVDSTADLTTVTMFNSSIVEDYQSNIKEQINKQEEFFVKDDYYYIGDDNPFNFRINAKGIDSNNNICNNLQEIRTSIQIEEVKNSSNGDEFIALNSEDLANIVDINTEKSIIDFNESAIGKVYRITVSAVNYDSEYFDSEPKFSLIAKVVDGYNVYTAKDLSVLDNTGLYGWNDIKSQEVTDICDSINGVILHSDIVIEDEDLPKGLFYNEAESKAIASGVTNQEIIGSVKDSAAYQMYGRYLKPNQKFNFIGNYYQIDYSKVAKIVVQDNNKDGIMTGENGQEKAITSHTCMFRFAASDGNQTFPEVNIKNVSFKGNGKRSASAIESGGMILLKTEGVEFTADNTIYQDCFIGYMFMKYDDNDKLTSNTDLSKYKIINTKGYNCYNSLLYCWGGKNLIIENSELIGAGGPVMIVDHVENDDTTAAGGFSCKVDIINSKLESFVTGQEPWFVTYGASAIMTQIKAADAVYSAIPEQIRPTFLVDKDNVADMINMVCVYKSGSAEGMTLSRVRGSVTIFDSREDYEAQINNGDKSFGLYFPETISTDNLVDKAMGSLQGAIGQDGQIDFGMTGNYFESNKTGGYVATNGDNFGEFYKGDYANVYLFNGMGAIFELFPYSE